MKHFILAVALATLAIPAQAGTTGVISGYARDENGIPVKGAFVRVVSATQQARTRSNSHGFFAFVDLAPDVYTLAAETPGKSPMSSAGLHVSSDQTIFVTITFLRSFGCSSLAKASPYDANADFVLVDLKQRERYPAQMRSLLTPIAPYRAPVHFYCL